MADLLFIRLSPNSDANISHNDDHDSHGAHSPPPLRSDAPIHWLTANASNSTLNPSVEAGTLADLSQHLSTKKNKGSTKVIVLLPTAEILLTQADTPAVSKNQIQRLIPFAVEDSLIEDIEDQHFALGLAQKTAIQKTLAKNTPTQPSAKQHDKKTTPKTLRGQRQQPVAIIQKNRMQARLEQLQHHGIPAETLLPESLSLPFVAGTWTLALEETRPALLRYGPMSVLAIETDNLVSILNLMIKQRQKQVINGIDDAGNTGDPQDAEGSNGLPETITVHDFTDTEQSYEGELEAWLESLGANSLDKALNESPEESAEKTQGIAYEWITEEPPILSWLAKHTQLEKSINLRQGLFGRQQQLSRLWKPWRLSLALAAMFLLIIPLSLNLDYQANKRHLEQLNQQAVSVFKEAFPEAKRIVNPRAQMENRLKALEQSQGGDHSAFLALLASAAPKLGDVDTLQLENLRFKADKLSLSLKIDSFEKLDALKKALADTGLNVEIQSATSNNNQVKAQLKLSLNINQGTNATGGTQS